MKQRWVFDCNGRACAVDPKRPLGCADTDALIQRWLVRTQKQRAEEYEHLADLIIANIDKAKNPQRLLAAGVIQPEFGAVTDDGLQASSLYYWPNFTPQPQPLPQEHPPPLIDSFYEDFTELESVELQRVEGSKEPMPDLVEPIVCYRAWDSRPNGTLRGVGMPIKWKPLEANKAACEDCGNPPNPDGECSCGFWGFDKLETLLSHLSGYSHDNIVVGKVYMWGRVYEHESGGFRSEYAYPKELWIRDPRQRVLGSAYNVPIRMKR